MKGKINYLIAASAIILLVGYLFSARQVEPDITEESKEPPVGKKGIILKEIPVDLTFAGERVPVEDIDVRERYDREIIVNTHFHSNTILLLKKANRWMPAIINVLKENDLPEDFAFLPFVEGGLTNDRSPKGAVGFWQLLSSTARELGLEVNSEVDERYDPIKSTEAACKYLKKTKEKFGTWTNAAASYNVGMRGFSRSIENQHTQNYYDLLLNEETSRYMFRILALKEIYTHPEEYGFSIPKDQLYPTEELEVIIINQSVNDLATFALGNGINYKILKRHNPWLRKNTLTLKDSHSEYELKLPINRQKIEKAEHTSDSLDQQDQ